jgi:hypothetical protein
MASLVSSSESAISSPPSELVSQPSAPSQPSYPSEFPYSFPSSRPPFEEPPSKKKSSGGRKSRSETLFTFDVFKAIGGGIEEFEISGKLEKFFRATPEKKNPLAKTLKHEEDYYRAITIAGQAGIGEFHASVAKAVKFYPSTRKKGDIPV